jgi:hypothetical protein
MALLPRLRGRAPGLGGWVVRDVRDKAEHFRNLAIKYHDMAKVAEPAYLGSFYRNVAVRYVFMAQEASARADRATAVPAQLSSSATDAVTCLHESRAEQDLDLLAVWANGRF